MLTRKQTQARLRWACRRGMLELDLLLLPFVEEVFLNLSLEEQNQFERLLACPDQDLYRWLVMREKSADKTLNTIIERVRSGS